MDFRRLEAFSKVYELKSFSKAGQSLYLSQPTISAHVAALENELGVLLFDRLGRTILPTAAGEVLYKYSKEAFASLASAKAEIQLLQDKVSGVLQIGGSTIPALYLLPELMTRFKEQYPEVVLSLHAGDTQTIINQVLRGELTLGVVGAKEDQPELVYTPLIEDELVLVAAPGFYSGNSSIPLKNLADWSWIMREKGSGTRMTLEKGLTNAGFDPGALNSSVSVDSTQGLLQFVKAGVGFGVTSRLAAKESLKKGELVEIKIENFSLQRNFYCVYHSQRHYFPAARYFISFLESEGAKVVRDQS